MSKKITLLAVFALLVFMGASACAVQEPDVPDAEWSMMIGPDATIIILHHGVPVATATHVALAEKGVKLDSRFTADDPHDGNATLTGTIAQFDLAAEGRIHPVGSRELRVDYQLSASKEHAPIDGIVLDWKFVLTSPAFASKPGAPMLLENNLGWMWRVGTDQFVSVRFEEPLDRLIHEAGKQDNVRAFLVADRLDPGIKRIRYSVELPAGGRIVPSPEERYGRADTSAWFHDALKWDESPVDLSFLNAADRPAGRRGFIKADRDRLAFEDGTPARFWGANLGAAALFSTPHQNVARQAHRLAQLGFNLVRIIHHDAPWIEPNIFDGNGRHDTSRLSDLALERIDWWVKCLKDEGIYVWLDLASRRSLTDNDFVKLGSDEIKQNHGYLDGFNYLNKFVVYVMREFQRQYLSHVNQYTHLAYKDDPAVVGILITNENDLTTHFGTMMLPDKNPVHHDLLTREFRRFGVTWGWAEDQLKETWAPGPSKLVLNSIENRFNQVMIGDLRGLGVRALIATTSAWGEPSLYGLPALTVGDVIDVHAKGGAESLSANPRYAPNFIHWIGAARVEGKPLSITEWSTPFPAADRFTAPLYLASIAALQGWDMPIYYDYAQRPLTAPGGPGPESRIAEWSSYNDPALCGVMPAAAVAFRRGHVSPARSHYCLALDRAQLIDSELNARTAAAIRTLVEQSRLSIGLPTVKELPWLLSDKPPGDATVVTEPDRDFIAPKQSFVRSDTGEILRNWRYGIQTIDTPRTQAVSGWLGGKTIRLRDATIRVDNPKAVVVLTSLDDQPLSSSRSILITAMARAQGATPGHLPFLSEPVTATVELQTKADGLELVALGPSGKAQERLVPSASPDGVTVSLPTRHGTHWYALRAGTADAGQKAQ